MNDREHELFEAELRSLTPARPPAALMARLVAARSAAAEEAPEASSARPHAAFPQPSTLRSTVHPPQYCPPSAVLLRRTGYGGRATEDGSTLNPQPFWRPLLRWLAPAAVAAVLAAALLAWWPRAPQEQQHASAVTSPPGLAPKPDDIEIDRQLVGIFDTVAQLPSGQPVRFLCREWEDDVVVRDPSGGLEIERHTPRLEVVPVSFEIY